MYRVKEGDRVRLNINQIKAHPDWKILSESYRAFVVSNTDTIFTVEYDRRREVNPTLVCFKEDGAKWLFWIGDLLIQDSQSGDFITYSKLSWKAMEGGKDGNRKNKPRQFKTRRNP